MLYQQFLELSNLERMTWRQRAGALSRFFSSARKFFLGKSQRARELTRPRKEIKNFSETALTRG